MVQRGLTPPKSDSPVLPKGLLSDLAEKEAKSDKICPLLGVSGVVNSLP